MLSMRLGRFFVGALVTVGLLMPGLSWAAAISQSYPASGTIVAGTILGLAQKSSNTVKPATNTGQASELIGVAVDQPLLQLTTGAANSVQVATEGTTPALVSDINGPIVAGDKITDSPITGVGMKAALSGEIVGTAQAALSSVPMTARTITGSDGKTTSVKVGLVPVAVTIAYYSAPTSGSLSAFIPPFLQNFANAVSGKSVSPVRVLLSLTILLLGTITVIVMLNSAIRSDIISIGRNPLAAKALRKSLLYVVLAALGILLITGAAVYGVLSG